MSPSAILQCTLAQSVALEQTLVLSRTWAIFLLYLVASWGAQGVAEEVPTQQVDAIFSPWKSNHAPGGAVLVIRNGRIVFKRGYGITELKTFHKIDSRTNFRLASLTKQFTAMAIMLLVHDGRLHYEDRLTGIFPDFPGYGKSITIRNLLNHTSGLLDYEDPMAAQGNVPEEKLGQISDAEVFELVKQQNTTKFTPGTKWDYSNSGYVLLGVIVEKITGKSFPQFLHERIFAPLNMRNTLAYLKGKNSVPNRAYGHTPDGNGWRQTDQSSTSATLGDGGVYSSLADLAKWDKALREHTLLSEAEMRAAVTPVKVADQSVKGPDGEPADYGFGWFLNPYRGHARMWHYGETVGFRTSIQRMVGDNLTIIVLCNRSDVNPSALALKVADLYLH